MFLTYLHIFADWTAQLAAVDYFIPHFGLENHIIGHEV